MDMHALFSYLEQIYKIPKEALKSNSFALKIKLSVCACVYLQNRVYSNVSYAAAVSFKDASKFAIKINIVNGTFQLKHII